VVPEITKQVPDKNRRLKVAAVVAADPAHMQIQLREEQV
jgi:hypothetical protein